MRPIAREFSSQIELPCTVSCGANGEFTFVGTAISIGSTRLVFRLKGSDPSFPRVGDTVRMNIHLPGEAGLAAKDISTRARIVDVSELADGVQTFVLSFRRAQFRDRPASAERRASAGSWEM